MINPILDPIGHKKYLEDLKNQIKIKPIKRKAKREGNNPVVTTTISRKHVEFMTDLSVNLTVKYRKSFNQSQILRLIIEYAEQFKDEIPLFYETTLK